MEEQIYKDNKILVFNDGSCIATAMVDGEVDSKDFRTVKGAKNWIDEKVGE